MKTFIAVIFAAVILFFSVSASAEDSSTDPCRMISGTVEHIRGSTAELALPQGGYVRVGILCLPNGATVGTVIDHGRIDSAATRRLKNRPVRVRLEILRVLRTRQ